VLVSQGVKNDQGEPERQPVTFPLEVRGETIGFIDVWPEENNLSAQESDFLQTISSRLSQTMESARLFEEARNRAYHEQAINAMTSRISRSMDMETLLSEAVQELSNLPGVMEISVHVGAADPLQEASGEASQQAHTPGGNGKK
jgi:GAF domain-containing protein